MVLSPVFDPQLQHDDPLRAALAPPPGTPACAPPARSAAPACCARRITPPSRRSTAAVSPLGCRFPTGAYTTRVSPAWSKQIPGADLDLHGSLRSLRAQARRDAAGSIGGASRPNNRTHASTRGPITATRVATRRLAAAPPRSALRYDRSPSPQSPCGAPAQPDARQDLPLPPRGDGPLEDRAHPLRSDRDRPRGARLPALLRRSRRRRRSRRGGTRQRAVDHRSPGLGRPLHRTGRQRVDAGERSPRSPLQLRLLLARLPADHRRRARPLLEATGLLHALPRRPAHLRRLRADHVLEPARRPAPLHDRIRLRRHAPRSTRISRTRPSRRPRLSTRTPPSPHSTSAGR